MNETSQLQRINSSPLSVTSTESIIARVMASPDALNQLSVVKEMLEIRNKEEARQAEKDFIAAFAALQREIPHIKATYAVPTASGGVKFRGAHLIDIMRQVEPLLSDHGFSIMFESSSSAGDAESRTVSQTCVLMHVGGHSKKSTSCVRVGGRFDSSAQMDAGAYTTAKRLAVCDLLNIHVDRSDVAILGDFISPDQAAQLKARFEAVGGDKAKFLALAQAESFETIRQSKYGVLDKMLATKEKLKNTVQ
jgi:hypothetical protein